MQHPRHRLIRSAAQPIIQRGGEQLVSRTKRRRCSRRRRRNTQHGRRVSTRRVAPQHGTSKVGHHRQTLARTTRALGVEVDRVPACVSARLPGRRDRRTWLIAAARPGAVVEPLRDALGQFFWGLGRPLGYLGGVLGDLGGPLGAARPRQRCGDPAPAKRPRAPARPATSRRRRPDSCCAPTRLAPVAVAEFVVRQTLVDRRTTCPATAPRAPRQRSAASDRSPRRSRAHRPPAHRPAANRPRRPAPEHGRQAVAASCALSHTSKSWVISPYNRARAQAAPNRSRPHR